MASAMALDKAIYSNSVLDKATEACFFAKPSDNTTHQEKTVAGSRSSRILITGPFCIRETIKNIPISLTLILDAKIGNTFDVMQGVFNSLLMPVARGRKKLS
jgi:hypothetical protein